MRKMTGKRSYDTILTKDEKKRLPPKPLRKTFLMNDRLRRMERATMELNGWTHTYGSEWNVYYSMRNALNTGQQLRKLHSWQRVQGYPLRLQWGFKDSLWRLYSEKQREFGEREFGFMTASFVLPEEKAAFEEVFRRQARETPDNNTWIVKDPEGAGGKGIYIADALEQVDLQERVLVSSYLKNPLLANGFKYDLRIYVLIASLDPLAVYVYDEGLARLSSFKYSFDAPLDKLGIHLNNVAF